MIMADVFMVTFLILGFFVVTIAYWVAAVGLAPNLVKGSAERYGTSPWKSLLIGAAIGIPLFGIGLGFANAGGAPVKMIGALLALSAFLAGLCGSAGLCLRIGKGLNTPQDAEQPWLRVKRGGIVLGLMIIFPILGWVFVLPLALLSGVGALFLSWRDSRNATPAEAA